MRRFNNRIVVISLLLDALFFFKVSAATGQAADKNPDQMVNNLIDKVGKKALPDSARLSQSDPTMPLAPDKWLLDDSTKAQYQAAVREYYEYHIFGHHHRRDVFKWQLRSEKIIFFAVLFLVFAGIVFAAIQFYSGLKPKPTGESAPSAPATTEISASMAGIKVSSPVLGVIILVISLLFFYLYLVYVYPIKEIF